MTPPTQHKAKEDGKPSLFETIGEIYAWLEVVFAFAVTGCIIALIIYYAKPEKSRLYIGMSVILLSLVAGIILANRTAKKRHAQTKAAAANTDKDTYKNQPG